MLIADIMRFVADKWGFIAVPVIFMLLSNYAKYRSTNGVLLAAAAAFSDPLRFTVGLGLMFATMLASEVFQLFFWVPIMVNVMDPIGVGALVAFVTGLYPPLDLGHVEGFIGGFVLVAVGVHAVNLWTGGGPDIASGFDD